MNAVQSFFDEINNDTETTDFNNTCLISNEPLDNTHITLVCGHSFNYINIYMDTYNQKKNTTYSQYILKPYQLRCPYCRNVQDKLLPYKIIDNVEKKYGVNSPNKFCMKLYTCDYIFKKGKNKGLKCNKECDEPFCKLHSKGKK
tara:strand:+ start:184 stop:615 length:432 start_codon:yes stop_codon:yes gene_type:complete